MQTSFFIRVGIVILLVPSLLTSCDLLLPAKSNPSGPEIEEDDLNLPPTASFTISPEQGHIWDVFKFDASSSSDTVDERIDLRYSWVWSRGNQKEEYAWGRSFKISKNFPTWCDSISVKLSVRDQDGLVDTCRKTFYIEPIGIGVARLLSYSDQLGGNTGNSASAISSDGYLYLGGGPLREILLPAGALKRNYWGVKLTSPVLGSDENIYGCTGSALIAIDRASAQVQWQYTTPVSTVGSPAMSDDGTLFFSAGNTLYSLNRDQTLEWTLSVDSKILSSPTIAGDGTIYIGCDDSALYAVNPDGSLKWTHIAIGPWAAFHSSPALGGDGTIYIGCDDRYLYAIHPGGTLQWAFKTIGMIKATPVIGTDGSIYIGTQLGYFYSIDPGGQQNWQYRTPGAIEASAVVGADGTIYVEWHRGHVFAFDQGGSLIRYYWTGWSGAVSPTIHPSGTVCFGGAVLDSDSMGLADSPWPTFRGNISNTGRR